LGFRIQVSGLMNQGSGFRALGLKDQGFRVEG